MQRTYSGHFDLHGAMVPGPNKCHPALTQYRHIFETVPEDLMTIKLPVPGSTIPLPRITEEDVPMSSSLSHFLEFTRGQVEGKDDHGQHWHWEVWIDQYGRGLGMRAEKVP